MGLNITQKILKAHLLSGEMTPGREIGLKIDQTLTQDATGTMAYLEFESMGIPRVNTELSVAYIDHNMLQSGFENPDDHLYIQSVARKYGLRFSRPGNGICHQVHLERFGIPGKTLIGSDSHTPTAGGLGMLGFGAGGLDVAVAMGGGAYYINMPRIIRVELKGKLRDFVTAKDVSLELLRLKGVKGGVGAVFEWGGEGVSTLSVPERATITNMGAETGATTSVFPSDRITKAFLEAQGRGECFVPVEADPDAVYDEIISIDLSSLEPLAACPHSPGNVVTVKSLAGMKVDQVCIGSCTNSSLQDMLKCAALLKGKTISPGVSMSVSPGTRQVLTMLSSCGALNDILNSGARLLECGCGPCIGMGFSPNSGGISLRTFNRNFEGRSGTKDAQVYLVSPETAVASALTGVLTDPSSLGRFPEIPVPLQFTIDDSGILPPLDEKEAANAEVLRGPNIKPFPGARPLEDNLEAELILKTGDNISTDHIMPAGAKVLPYRSNIPKISEFCFTALDPSFPERAKAAGKSILVGGSNYGQGSSREHAALAPLYLGVRVVIAKSLARIHAANLINAGILPLTFADPADYDRISQGDRLSLHHIHEGLDKGTLTLRDETKGLEIPLTASLNERQKAVLKAGGLLQYTKQADTRAAVELACAQFKKLLTAQLEREEAIRKETGRAGLPSPGHNASFPALERADGMPCHTIGLIDGDGIGPVIMEKAREVLKVLLEKEETEGRIRFRTIEGLTIENRLKTGQSVPTEVLEAIRSCDVLLKGPTETPKGGTMASANVTLRRELDLFANVRPVRVPEAGIDWTFFRENTEGEYVLGSSGIEIPDRLCMDFKVTTDPGTRRIARAAFEYAKNNGKTNVAIVTKANIMKKTDGRFSELCHDIAKEYPEITVEDWYVDIMTARLIDPEAQSRFQVFVLPNLYGDIITDEAAQIQGGVGTAGSANIGSRYAMFEAIHGTAPRMIQEGLTDYADPSSILKASVLLLRHIGLKEKADLLEEALEDAVEKQHIRVTGSPSGATGQALTEAVTGYIRRFI